MSGNSGKSLSASQLRDLRRLEESFRTSFDDHLRRQYIYRAIAFTIVTLTLHVIVDMAKKTGPSHHMLKDSIARQCMRFITLAACFYFFTTRNYRKNLFCATIYLERVNFSLVDFNLRFCGKERRLEIID